MNSSEAKKAVCAVLKEVQDKRGQECPPLKGATKPLKDLPKFTSPTSIGATGMVAKKLGVVIPPEVNIFGDDQGVYSIDITVSLICAIADDSNKSEAAAA